MFYCLSLSLFVAAPAFNHRCVFPMRDLLTDIARWGGKGSGVETRTRSVVIAKGREKGASAFAQIFCRSGAVFLKKIHEKGSPSHAQKRLG